MIKYVIYSLAFGFFSTIAVAMDEPAASGHFVSQKSKIALSGSELALEHFKLSSSHIHELLKDQETVELHFYWSSPDIRSEKFDSSMLKVQIGGEKYAKSFPLYLDALLGNSPENLHVRFVCDSLTRETNIDWIGLLQEKYKSRFFTVDVNAVHNRILEMLTDLGPTSEETLRAVFQNATQGNPAITSDIYRVIGMPFINPETSLKRVFAYCDIDTFCEGMESPDVVMKKKPVFEPEFRMVEEEVPANGHTNLLSALFAKPVLVKPEPKKMNLFAQHDPTSTFYIGRRDDEDGKTNEVIKIKIVKLQAYRAFCERVLMSVNMNVLKYKSSFEGGHLGYFPLLFNFIRKVETQPDSFTEYLNLMGKFSLSVRDIIDITGPGLTKALDEFSPLGIPFPKVSAWSWHGCYELEYTRRYIFGSIRVHDSQKGEEFENLVRQYEGRVKDAFFARKFGESHPFNVKIRQYLQKEFPFFQELFKNILKETWESETGKISFMTWAGKKIKELQTQDTSDPLSSPQAAILINILKRLGIEMTWEVSDYERSERKE